jgi:hypothetical protein
MFAFVGHDFSLNPFPWRMKKVIMMYYLWYSYVGILIAGKSIVNDGRMWVDLD